MLLSSSESVAPVIRRNDENIVFGQVRAPLLSSRRELVRLVCVEFCIRLSCLCVCVFVCLCVCVYICVCVCVVCRVLYCPVVPRMSGSLYLCIVLSGP